MSTREPVDIEFVLKGDIEKEIDKVSKSVKSAGTEGEVAYKKLKDASANALSSLSKDAQIQAVALQKVILEIKRNEEAMEQLKTKFDNGQISANAFAKANAKLSIEQAELKNQAAGLSKQIQDEINLNKEVVGSQNRKLLKLKQLKEAYNALSDEERNNVNIGGKIITQIKQLDAETSKVKTTLKGAENSQKGWIDKLKATPGPVGSAVSGIDSMTRASLKFIATPLGAILAAIALALKAVTTWFKRTNEGQQAMISGTAYFNQILDTFLNTVSKVGEWLYKAFNKPKEALNDLGDFLKGQIINRLTAFGKIGAAVQKIFTDDWKQGFIDLNNATGQLVTGVEDVGFKFLNFLDDTNEKSIRQNEIAGKLRDIDLEDLAIKREVAAAETKIAELRAGAKDVNADDRERLKLIQDAQKLLVESADKEINSLKERLKLEREAALLKYGKTDVSTLPIEVQEKLNNLEVEILNKQAERANKQRELLDQQNAITNALKREKSEQELLQEELEKKKEAYALFYNYILATDKKIARDRFADLIKEGDSYLEFLNAKIKELQSKTNRTSKEDIQLGVYQTEYNKITGTNDPVALFKKEIEEKKKLYADDLEAYRDYLNKKRQELAGDGSEQGYNKKVIIDAEIVDSQAKNQKNIDELVKQYQTFTLTITSLEKDYNRDMLRLKAELANKSSKYTTADIEEAMKARTQAYEGALAQVTSQDSEFFQVLFGNLENYSKRSLDKAINSAQQFLNKYKDEKGNWLDELDADTVALLIKIQEGIAKAEKESASKLPENLRNTASILSDLSTLTEDWDSGLSDVLATTGEVLNGFADIAKGIADMNTNPVAGIAGIVKGLVGIYKAIKGNLEASKQVLADYNQMLLERNLAEYEYNELLRERLRTQQQIGETTLEYNARITAELLKQKQANRNDYASVFAQLQNEQYISGTKYKHGTWFRKAKTTNEYASLMGMTFQDIEKLYNSNQLTEASAALFEQLQALKEEGEDIDAMLQEQAEAMREAYTGTTTDSIINSIVDGFAQGYKSAADFADTFESLMKTAVLQALKLQVLEEPIRQWYEQFAANMEDGTLSAEEIAALNKLWNSIIEQGTLFMSEVEKATGLTFGDTSQNAQAGAFKTMTEETGSRLEGHFVAVRVYTGRISESVSQIAERMAKHTLHLANIERNTQQLMRLEAIERTLSRVENDGIKLKN